jgi:hypothetical protein
VSATGADQAQLHPTPRKRWQSIDENPHVYRILVDLARAWKANTNKPIGIKALFERARWELAFRTSTSPDLKLNNSLAPYYSRLIMEQEEDLAGLFRTRKSGADRDPIPFRGEAA